MNNLNVIEVKEAGLDAFEGRLAKLNKLGQRIGKDAITAHVIDITSRTVRISQQFGMEIHDTLRTATFNVVRLAIIGVAPVYDDVTVAGYVEDLEGTNLVHAIGGQELAPEASRRLRDWSKECDHCGVKRGNRKGAFAVYRDGQLYVVGNTCVAQFVGRAGLDPKCLGEYCGAITLLEEGGNFDDSLGGGRTKGVDTIVAFVLAATAINHVGYTSKKAAQAYFDAGGGYKETTAGVMMDELVQPKGYFSNKKGGRHPDLDPTLWEHTDEDWAVAAGAREWASQLSGQSDYERNLIALANASEVPFRRFGFIAAAVQGYLKSIDKAAEYAKAEPKPVSQWVGTVGKRETFEGLTVVKLVSMAGFRYGDVTTLHKFVDVQGNKLSWFKSGSPDMAEGDVVTLKGTVKAQKDDPKWGRETQLTRCQLL